MRSRVITASIGIPILVAVIFAGGFWFSGLVLLLAAIGTLELTDLLDKIGFRAPKSILVICVSVIIVLVHFVTMKEYEDFHLLAFIIAIAAIFLVWQVERFKYRTSIIDWLITFLMVIVFGGVLAYAILLRNLENGVYLAYWMITVVIISDTSAFFVGRKLGKHKLAPKISPMKTIEGAIGGILGAVITSVIINYIFTNLKMFDTNISVFVFVIGGVLIACISIVGDLTESKLKRMAGVKDSGTIFPGHGGVLDRLDSIIFNLPVIYYGFIWVS